jgi:tetratricopeptide (TPR) repeat protein
MKSEISQGTTLMKFSKTPIVLSLCLLFVLTGCLTIEEELTEKDFVKLSLDLYSEGIAAAQRKDYDVAHDYFSRSLTLSPRPIVYYQLARLEQIQGDLDSARANTEKALVLSPEFTPAKDLIKSIDATRQLQSSTTQPILATKPPEPVVVASPKAPDATPSQPTEEKKTPEITSHKAIEPVSAATEPEGDNIVEGLNLLKKEKYQEAIEWFQKRRMRDAGNAVLCFYQGNAHFGADEYVKAYNAYNQAIQLDPDMARAYVNLGYCQEMLGRSRGAEASYKRAIEINNHPDALYNLGLLCQKRGQFAQSIKHLETYVQLKPDTLQAKEAQRQLFIMRRER